MTKRNNARALAAFYLAQAGSQRRRLSTGDRLAAVQNRDGGVVRDIRHLLAVAKQWRECAERAEALDARKAERARRRADTFTVTGGEGSLTVCAETGDILSRDPSAYPSFTRIDVAEWRAFYPGETLAGQTVDVLDTAGWEGESYSPAESDFRLELAFAHNGGGEFIPAERFRSVEVCGVRFHVDAVEALPGRPARDADAFGVYGREAEGDPLAVHLFDMASHASALALAIEYATRDALPVHNLVAEEA